MAGGGGSIVQNIVLAGQDDVIAGLNAIGNAGVQAFSALSNAAQSISISAPLGALTGFSAALATVTAGFFEWADASANATVRTANFGDELGASAQQMTTLITALAQGGNQVTDLTTSFRRLAVSVESEWPTIQKSVRNATNLMKEDYIKIGEANVELQFSNEKLSEQQNRNALDVQKATLGVAEAKENLVKTDNDNAIQMQANAVDVLSAESQLSQALFALDHARRPATKQEKAAQVEQQAGIAALQAQLALERAIKQQQEEQTQAALKHRQAVLAIAEAQQRLREAERKAREDEALAPLRKQKAELDAQKAQAEQREHQANDIDNLKQYVDNLASGASNANSKVQLSSANLIKGLIASVGPGIGALESFKGALGDLGQQAPKLYDVMLKVADIFHHTTDETLRAAIATALFGRGYSFSLVEALSQGSEAIKAAQEKIANSFDLTKEKINEQVSTARELQKALFSLGEGIKLVSAQITTIISPVFSTLLRGLEAAVEANRTKFLEWATVIRDFLTPAITGFVASLAGINLANAFNLSPEQILKAAEWKQTADNIKEYVVSAFSAIKDFLTESLPAAFGVVMAGFNTIAAIINTFGGNVSGAQVAITLLIGQLTGLNNAILAAALALGGLAIALASNPFGLIVIGCVLAIAALTALGVAIYRNRDAINAWLINKHDITGGAFQWLVDAFEDACTKIKRMAEDVAKDIIDTLKFKDVATRQAEQQAINKKRAEEDEDTASRRQARDNPVDESEGLNTDKPKSGSTVSPPLTQENAWKSLGSVMDSVFDKSHDKLEQLSQASGSTSAKTQKIIQDIVNQAKASEEAAQKHQSNIKKSSDIEKEAHQDRMRRSEEIGNAARQNGGFVEPENTQSRGYNTLPIPIPLPRPRPPEADQPIAPTTPVQPQDIANLASSLKDAITSALTGAVPKLTNDNQQEQEQAQVPQPASTESTAAGSDSSGFSGALQAFTQALQTAAQQIAAVASSINADISEAPGHATGGPIGGKPGRDTNLIWASRGEFMQSEPAVQHYGEGFMHAVNQRKLPKFWSGGLIGSMARINTGMIPKYESGGPIAVREASPIGNNSGMQQVHFHAADGRTIGKGFGDRDLVEGLQRFSTAGSRYSTGRAQSWRT